MYGQAYDRGLDPVGLVQESVASGHPVIYAAVNFRVGRRHFYQPMVGFVADVVVFGFAASRALHDAKSENIGLRDQRLALQCELIYLWGLEISCS